MSTNNNNNKNPNLNRNLSQPLSDDPNGKSSPTINSTSSDNPNQSLENEKSGNGMGAASYYGAVVIVVFLAIALSVIFRILYSRRARRRNQSPEEPDEHDREQEERMAMERRGEQPGLPTYRESTLLPNNDTILAATPMSDTPFPRPNTAETLNNSDSVAVTVLPPIDQDDGPPKYEQDDNQEDPSLDHHDPPIEPAIRSAEMRMSLNAPRTVSLHSIHVTQPDEHVDLSSDDPSRLPPATRQSLTTLD